METSDLLLHMTGISKRYGNVRALDDVSFELRRGEVMALLGENGAGKSTIVKILSGLVTPDQGDIRIDGEPVHLGSSAASRAAGIAVVQQELSLVPTMTVAENVFLGGTEFKGAWAGRRMAAAARPYLERVGLGDLDPRTYVGSLSIGTMQLVEIARLLARQARILILDEPTAALSDVEIDRVKKVVRQLADSGHSVIYVTHRLGEVFDIGDRSTVMRNGQSSAAVPVAELTIESLVENMLGRRLGEMYPPRGEQFGEVRLEIRELEAPGLEAPVSLQVHRGEIVGLGGQLGSGAPVVLRAVAGHLHTAAGEVRVDGDDVTGYSVGRSMAAGVAYCSDDRKRDGIFARKPVAQNLSSPALARVSRAGWLSSAAEKKLASGISDSFSIKRDRLGSAAGNLSGGNQQKVALGKWVGIAPRVLLVEEPTRGVDVGARAEIYGHLRRLANDGLSILFVSSDLPEVLGLADTVATFYKGRMVRIQPADRFTETSLMQDVTHNDHSALQQNGHQEVLR